mmetsp:Transcript_45920/g.33666  ORF Transcript_45920/g.33666 Transcript_45920/m.33666 type:complete len:81 (+) Transcript_45920:544-786(+)
MHKPLDDWRDDVMVYAKKAEKGINNLGDKLQDSWQKSGIEKKIGGWFKKITKKNKDQEPQIEQASEEHALDAPTQHETQL